MAPDRPTTPHAPSDAFAYACHGCTRCCHNKTVRISPYGVARLAEALGQSTTDVLATEIDPETWTLPRAETGACRYLHEGRCTVHSGRPLACRLYPLRWFETEAGDEVFIERRPDPESLGVYGIGGTVAGYLDEQGTRPYQRAIRRYKDVHRRLAAAAEVDGPDPGELPPLTDVDAAVTADCAARGILVPDDVDARVELHLALLHRWLDAAGALPAGDS